MRYYKWDLFPEEKENLVAIAIANSIDEARSLAVNAVNGNPAYNSRRSHIMNSEPIIYDEPNAWLQTVGPVHI